MLPFDSVALVYVTSKALDQHSLDSHFLIYGLPLSVCKFDTTIETYKAFFFPYISDVALKIFKSREMVFCMIMVVKEKIKSFGM